MPFLPFLGLGEGSPTKIDYRKKGALILTCLLKDLGDFSLSLYSPQHSVIEFTCINDVLWHCLKKADV